MRPAAGAVLVALLVLSAGATPQPEAAPPPRVKPLPWPPLPAGAVARIGQPRLRHAGSAINVAFAPTGTTFVTTGGGTTPSDTNRLVVFWDAATGRELKQLRGHAAGVEAVAFSADGKLLATGDTASKIRVWNLADDTSREFDGSGGRVLAVAFSPDGRQLASTGHDKLVRVWDVATGENTRQHPAATSQGTSNVRYSPDGKWLAGVGADWAVRLWDAATGEEVRALRGPKSDVLSFDFSPDGKRLAALDAGGKLWVWEPDSGKELAGVQAHPAVAAPGLSGTCVRVSPAGTTIATGAADGTLRFWDLAGKPLRSAAGHPGRNVSEIAFSADGAILASVDHGANGRDGTIRLWDVATGWELPQSGGVAARVALSPDGARVATAGAQPVVRFWDTATGAQLPPLPLDRPARAIAFSADGRTLVTSDSPEELRVWDLETNKLVRTVGTPTGGPAERVAVGPAGQVWVTSGGGTVRVWKADDAKAGPTAIAVRPPVSAVALSPGDRYLALAGGDGRLRVRDLGSGREVFAVPDRPGALGTVSAAPAWSSDGRSVAGFSSGDRMLRVWEAVTGQERRPPVFFPTTAARSAAFSPDGRVLAAGGDGGVFRLWDVRTGRELVSRTAHAGPVTFLAFTPDGRFLVSAGADWVAAGTTTPGDATVLVWDAAALVGDLPATPKPAAGEVEALWADLAGPDPAKAHDAVWRLAAAPELSLPLIRDRLPRVGSVGQAAPVAKLLADLDNDSFEVREKATQDLIGLGPAVIPAVREARQETRSREVLRRTTEVLDKLAGGPAATPEEVLTARGVEVLQKIGSADAREVLRSWAGGPAGSALAREARAALDVRSPP